MAFERLTVPACENLKERVAGVHSFELDELIGTQ
jgi:hypothetical protein